MSYDNKRKKEKKRKKKTMVLELNGFTRDSNKGNHGESDINSCRRKEVVFYRQIHTRACTDLREGGREGKTDRRKER